MNRSSALALGLIGAFMLAGSAGAQTGSSTGQTDADRVARRCTTGELAPGASAQCSDDAVYDGPLRLHGAVGTGSNNPALPSGSNPPTLPPVAAETNPAGQGNPASIGNPGSLTTNPPSLSNNPPSLISPGNTGSTGTGTTSAPPVSIGGGATAGSAAAPAQPAAGAVGGRR